jgi:rare lipoprotein A
LVLPARARAALDSGRNDTRRPAAGQRHEGTFRSVQDSDRSKIGTKQEAERSGGEDRGGEHRCPLTAAFRSDRSAAQSGRQNVVVSQRKEVVVKGRMMLFAVSILSFEFSPTIVTPSAAGQAGIASVYSYESGSRTASGQKLNHEALTAAHRTLPFGSKVKVTNNRNGRTVVVTINDRGPFVRGRVIDVSPAAAQELGFTGLAQVSIDNAQDAQ